MLNNGFKEFNVQKVQNPNKCWRQIIVGPIKNIVEKFGPQNFGSKNIGVHKNWGPTNINWGAKNCYLEKFEVKINLCPKYLFGPINYRLENNKCWVHKSLGSKKCLGPKIFVVPKKSE